MKNAIERHCAAYPLASNPYLSGLRDGSLSREDFLETQIQFYFAVVFFSRPMAVLAARMPSAALRMEILRNVWEEHGEGQIGQGHGSTFLELLARLEGWTHDDVERRVLGPEVRAFNTALAGCCSLDDWEIGAGMLGIIEYRFVEISNWIGRAIVARGWLPAERMVHYDVHEELDVRHSQDFFDALQPAWEEGPEARYRIEQGFALGAYLFDRLYRDLFEARARRQLTDVQRPQAHIYAE